MELTRSYPEPPLCSFELILILIALLVFITIAVIVVAAYVSIIGVVIGVADVIMNI